MSKRNVKATVKASDYRIDAVVSVTFNGFLVASERQRVILELRDRMMRSLAGLPFGPDYLTAVKIK